MRNESLTAYFNEVAPTLGARQIKVMEVFECGEAFTNSEIAERLGWSINRVTPRVLELRRLGVLEEGGLRTCRITGRTVNTWKASCSNPEVRNEPQNHIFQFESKSRAGEIYKVSASGSSVTCSCPGFKFRGKCSHLEKVEKRLVIINSMRPLF